jgi:hypothetical protein
MRHLPSKGSIMSDPEDEAEQLFKDPKPAPAKSEYQLEQEKIRANFQRLRAERLARGAGKTVNDQSDES